VFLPKILARIEQIVCLFLYGCFKKNPEALIKPHFFHERKTIGHGESVIAGCLKAASKKSLANPACYHRQS